MSASPGPNSDGEEEYIPGEGRPTQTKRPGVRSKDQRLFDLIDAMDPAEKQSVLMSAPRSRPSPSKAQCCRKLAMKLSPNKTAEKRSKGNSISTRLNYYQRKYAEMLNTMDLETYIKFCQGNYVPSEIENTQKCLAILKRLHTYWRTSPHHNPRFYDVLAPPTTAIPIKLTVPMTGLIEASSSKGDSEIQKTQVEQTDDSGDYILDKGGDDHKEHEVIDVDDESEAGESHIDLTQDSRDACQKRKSISTIPLVHNERNGIKRSRVSLDNDHAVAAILTQNNPDVDKIQRQDSDEIKLAQIGLARDKVQRDTKQLDVDILREKNRHELMMMQMKQGRPAP